MNLNKNLVLDLAKATERGAYGASLLKGKGDKTKISLRPERALINPNDKMDNIKYSSIPLNVSSIVNHKITNVACGSNFVILLDENGYCHSFGNGDEGVLGLGDGDDRSKPTLIESISNIVDIKCGGRHVLAKSKNKPVLILYFSFRLVP